MSASAEVERRALALLEELLDNPDDEAFAQTLLADEPEAVRVRIAALQTAMTQASNLLPTELPDGASAQDEVDMPAQAGAFRLVRRLGYGGMGGVWLGERAGRALRTEGRDQVHSRRARRPRPARRFLPSGESLRVSSTPISPD